MRTLKLTLNKDIQPGRGYVFITKPITNFYGKVPSITTKDMFISEILDRISC